MIKYLLIIVSIITLGALISDMPGKPPIEQSSQIKWENCKTYNLPNSHSTVSLPEGYHVLLGNEAKKMAAQLGITNNEKLEALASKSSNNIRIYFYYHDQDTVNINSFVTDSETLLESLKETCENQKNGYHVLSWIQKPVVNENEKTFNWTVQCKYDGNGKQNFNTNIIKLGKLGYEDIICVGDVEFYESFIDDFTVINASFSFNTGYQYTDRANTRTRSHYRGGGHLTHRRLPSGGKGKKCRGLAEVLQKAAVAIAAWFSALIKKIKNIFKRKDDKETKNDRDS